MRVNFASGTHPFPVPWWNVDLNNHVGVNERIDLLAEFPTTVTDIAMAYVGHWMEHITPDESLVFLARVHSAMRTGGRVVVVGPDVAEAERLHDAGRLSDDLLAVIRPHGERNGSDVSHIHDWETTGAAVLAVMDKVGFVHTRCASWGEFTHWGIPVISDAPWQYAVTGLAA